MKTTIVGLKCTPRDSFKERADLKLSKIEKFFPDGAEAKITAKVEKNKKIVEITVLYNNMIFRAEDSSNVTLEDALDCCVDLLIRQIKKNKTKLGRRLHSEVFSSFDDISVSEETEFDVVRTKSVDLKPQNIDEAILQMNMLGHMFYVFLNSDTDGINVVYKRKGGGYGIIEPHA